MGHPLVGGDHFAIRFAFDETDLTTGERRTTTKLSLFTVDAGQITREDVFYLGAA